MPSTRPPFTLEKAAQEHATFLKNAGDPRPLDNIYREALGDLKDSCCGPSGPVGGGPFGGTGQNTNPMTNGMPGTGGPGGQPGNFPGADRLGNQIQPGAGGLGGANGPGGPIGASGSDTIGGLGSTIGNTAGGLPLPGGLLGGGQGLNVAGIVGVGSDQGKFPLTHMA